MPKTCTSCKQTIQDNYVETADPDKVCCNPCIDKKNLEQCHECEDFFTQADIREYSDDGCDTTYLCKNAMLNIINIF